MEPRGILNRGGYGGATRRRASSLHPQDEEDEMNIYHGMWMYPEIMDIIALVAAIAVSVATSSILAFSYEEVQKADDRFLQTCSGRCEMWINQNSSHPVSWGLMTFSGSAVAISAFALVSSVTVRITLTYITKMIPHSKKRQFLLQWANPMSVVVLIVWATSILLSGPTLYFIGWVAFPPDIADHLFFVACGYTFILATILVFLLVAGLFCRANSVGKQEEEEANRLVAITRDGDRNDNNNDNVISTKTNTEKSPDLPEKVN